jgi:hypothetical protein
VELAGRLDPGLCRGNEEDVSVGPKSPQRSRPPTPATPENSVSSAPAVAIASPPAEIQAQTGPIGVGQHDDQARSEHGKELAVETRARGEGLRHGLFTNDLHSHLWGKI